MTCLKRIALLLCTLGVLGLSGISIWYVYSHREVSLASLLADLEANPTDSKLLVRIGTIFYNAGDFIRSEDYFNKAVLAAPTDLSARYYLGSSQYQLGKAPLAAKTFAALIEIQEIPAAMFNLALIYKYALDKPTEAKLLFERILAIKEAEPELKQQVLKELSEQAS